MASKWCVTRQVSSHPTKSYMPKYHEKSWGIYKSTTASDWLSAAQGDINSCLFLASRACGKSRLQQERAQRLGDGEIGSWRGGGRLAHTDVVRC